MSSLSDWPNIPPLLFCGVLVLVDDEPNGFAPNPGDGDGAPQPDEFEAGVWNPPCLLLVITFDDEPNMTPELWVFPELPKGFATAAELSNPAFCGFPNDEEPPAEFPKPELVGVLAGAKP